MRVEVERDVAGRMGAVDDASRCRGLRASAIDRSMGKSSAVGEVMWLRNSTRVRSVMPATSVSVNAASETSGIGTLTTTTSAPVLAADIGPGLFERRVFVVGGEDLVAGLEVERLGDDVEAARWR